MTLQDKLISGTHTTKHTTQNDLSFIRLSVAANLHASHRKGQMSTENDTNDLRICKLNLSYQVNGIIRYKNTASLWPTLPRFLVFLPWTLPWVIAILDTCLVFMLSYRGLPERPANILCNVDNFVLCFDNFVLCFDNFVLCFDNFVLCFDNFVLCFDNFVLCFDNFVLCFDNFVLCFDNFGLCFTNIVLCFKNIELCFKNCLLCLQIWATVWVRIPLLFSGLCSSSFTAALALMTVNTQLLLMDKLISLYYTWAKYNVHI